MVRQLHYQDAVRLLGGKSKVIKIADEASVVAMLVFGFFDLFEVRQEVVRLCGEAVTGFSERLRGISKMDRTERIHAAHQIIMLSALFEELDATISRLGAEAPRLTAAEVRALPAADPYAGEIVVGPADARHMENVYHGLARAMLRYISGLAVWDRLDETRRGHLGELIRDELPRQALRRYEEHLRRLAVDSPEFGVWLALRLHERTRAELSAGLGDLDRLLRLIAADSLPEPRRAALNRAYLAALTKPIAPSGTDTGLRIPELGVSYLDHRFRIDDGIPRQVADQDYWQKRDVHSDLALFLADHLISRESVDGPLLILGQPGSGKSVLTKILAGRLSAAGYLPVRVELRQVPADADIQDQIEAAIRADTGEDVRWPRLVESAPEALPVVLLDGFDELLQAAGVSHSDYLTRVARFQEREYDQGRPVAVIVTSRTAVANRATIPGDCRVISLEPFDEAQIRAWLAMWNQANAAVFADQGIAPLAPETALRYGELAGQPLLLLMLALYDASANGVLADRAADLDQTDIYERLLTEFARRELTKEPARTLTAEEIERELTQLSVVAFAMFTRGRQWIDEAGLTADLTGLQLRTLPTPTGLRAPLTPGQVAVGRFFFVHRADAQRDGEQSRTYEFLHATFSEYLVARLVVQVLQEMARREAPTPFGLLSATDDSMLHALLSFDCLAVRSPVVAFLEGLADRLPEDVRSTITGLLIRLHRTALEPRTESRFGGYLPRAANVVERCAAWSANLVLLAAVFGRGVRTRDLFAPGHDAVRQWHKETLIWRSQLRSESWTQLVYALAFDRIMDGRRRDLVVRLSRDLTDVPEADLWWVHAMSSEDGWQYEAQSPVDLHRKAMFSASPSEEVRAHVLAPLGGAFGRLTHTVVEVGAGRSVTIANVLLRAQLATCEDDGAAVDDLIDVVIEMRKNHFRGDMTENFHAFAYRILADLLTNDAGDGRGWRHLPDIHRRRDRIAALLDGAPDPGPALPSPS